MENLHFEYKPVIFTTGAFLKQVKSQIDGEDVWFWAVTKFIDDSFKDGDVYNPAEFAESRKQLFEEIE